MVMCRNSAVEQRGEAEHRLCKKNKNTTLGTFATLLDLKITLLE
jgi:hypothetical protein